MKKTAFLLLIFYTLCFAQETGARYLIITHDDYFDAIQPLAEWKHKKGIRTKVVTLTEIGGPSSTLIKNYITDAYYNWQIPPEFLLLVGAPNRLPFPQVSGLYSDNYYTNIEGDVYNEILSGRLTVHNTTEAQTVVNKILSYERTPDRQDSLWFKKACLIVNRDYDEDDSIYWSDVHYAASLMINAGFVEIDTLCDQYGHNANTVVNRINEGRSILMYRGVGFGNWSYPFNVNPDQTQNGTKLPIVLSTTCRTIGTGATPATAEKWLLTGTPTTPRGGAGYFATTTTVMSQAYLRSAVAKGFHNALFNGEKEIFGKACEEGRVNVYTMYPYQGGYYEYLGFTTLGDPEMHIWTDTPCSLICTHPSTIPVGNANFIVNVVKAGDLSPVNKAVVCVMTKLDTTVYAIDTTDNSGNAFFSVSPHFDGDTASVTVTGKNLQPYEGYMPTVIPGTQIAYLKSSIDDSVGGNNDSLVNPGENINLPLWVKNYGDSIGLAITGALLTADAYATITDSIKSFGDIPSGDSAYTDADGYNFTVATNCPNGHVVNFDLSCQDIDDSVWVSYFNIQVHAPDLIFQRAEISGGNGNSSLEPGETTNVVITVKNQGSVAVDSVDAVLRSLSPYVGVIDSLGSFDHIGPDSSAANSIDPFIVYSDTNAPQGTVHCEMIVSSGCYIDTIQFIIPVHAPSLIFQHAEISGGNGNSSFEPGETVNVVVTVKNQGRVAVDSVDAVLRSLSTYVGVIDSLGSFNHVASDSCANNSLDPFVVYSDSNVPLGTVVDFEMTVSSGYYLDTIPFSLVIGKHDYFIWNPDLTQAPGQNMHSILTNLGYQGDYGTTLASDLNLYNTVFVCAGVFPNNYVIGSSSPEAGALVDFLQNQGGCLYLEGGDVWYYDPPTGYNFCPLFGINASADGSSNMGPVTGETGVFTEGMNFTYGGENSYMDHIDPSGAGAFLIFHDGNDYYNCGVANDQGTYRTVGTSFELGLLDDGSAPSTRVALLDSIMHFFSVGTGVLEQKSSAGMSYYLFEIFPNPCRGKMTIRYSVGHSPKDIALKIYDVTGRMVKQFDCPTIRLSGEITWGGTDSGGRKLPGGIYFVQFIVNPAETADPTVKVGDFVKTQKVILMK